MSGGSCCAADPGGRGIGKLPPLGRSAKSQAVAYCRVNEYNRIDAETV